MSQKKNKRFNVTHLLNPFCDINAVNHQIWHRLIGGRNEYITRLFCLDAEKTNALRYALSELFSAIHAPLKTELKSIHDPEIFGSRRKIISKIQIKILSKNYELRLLNNITRLINNTTASLDIEIPTNLIYKIYAHKLSINNKDDKPGLKVRLNNPNKSQFELYMKSFCFTALLSKQNGLPSRVKNNKLRFCIYSTFCHLYIR